ncbi:thiamine pyrophosphate-binding protein [Paenibacillus chondroitinus]|uniref:Thiamine pyrophosphate-binding protein n=1 Tax=Paenibacillus chondroitinus TaxID=59842 RepID=A0ABU6DMC2_9BACL|nr:MULTISPECIES: thiamine pyrophosphate-binding protein [Paenibacillus]MCY9657425.1 thiamine pyrophosphate-binding protein [Paenibacillus anseongense]MEB4798910.1 thiamine pyrophosphate-binding protein [Paenibacillus chondroitinus]
MRAIEVGLRFLVQQGVKYVFGIPAGSINAIYDALLDIPELKPIVAKHENSSGYMAGSYTRITGIPSLCVASSGPGATNLVTPAANAWKQKLPVIFITGSVPSTKLGKGGAQELYAEPIFASITKMSRTVLDPHELPEILAEAYHTAVSGVPGPVHLAIPIDIQMKDIGERELPVLPPVEQPIIDLAAAKAAAQRIKAAGSKGAILLGHGAKTASESIVQFAEMLGWGVATTPRGKGAFPENHPLSLGGYGLSANWKASEYLNGGNHEVLLIIGSSLGELATSNWEPRLVAGRELIHIDYDANELGKVYETHYPVHGEIKLVIAELLEQLSADGQKDEAAVGEAFAGLAEAAAAAEPGEEKWNTRSAIRGLSAAAPKHARFFLDIGEFMTYSIQNVLIESGQAFDIDINFGGMGSGLGGVIGAQLAEPSRPTICITGDGCFFMHGLEVLTAKEYQLPILFVVINNARLGMVYHGHMLQYKRCLDDFSQERVSIAGIARSLGLRHAEITSLDQLQSEHVSEWLSHGEPVVVEVIVDGNEIPPMGERVKFLQGATY